MLQALRLVCALQELGGSGARPITALLPSLAQQTRGLATHGVGEGRGSTDGGVPRFYKEVTVKEAFEQGGYQLMLDQRTLKTPARRPLVVPTRALALAIAAEWEWQAQRIQPFTMPLMSLAATAIDQPKPREAVVDAMLQYLPTDSVVCRDEPGPVAELQAKVYDPILAWAHRELGVSLRPTHSIFVDSLEAADAEAVRSYLQQLDRWQLAAAEQLAACCKSVLIGLATMRGELGVQEALAAARLEEEHQVAHWGLVEGGHDIDIADLRVRVAAPALFVRLLNHS